MSLRGRVLAGMIAACFVTGSAAQEGTEAVPQSDSAARQTTRLGGMAVYESLSRGLPSWREQNLELVHTGAQRESYYVNLHSVDRFGLRDQEITGGYYFPLAGRWALLLEGGAGIDHQILPRWSAAAQIERALGASSVVQFGLRHTEYNDNNNERATLAFEHYWSNYRAAYTLSGNRLQGAGGSASHRGQLDYYYGSNNSSAGISYATGRELENLGASGILVSDITSFALTGRHGIEDYWGVTYSLSHHQQGASYTRKGAGIGIYYVF